MNERHSGLRHPDRFDGLFGLIDQGNAVRSWAALAPRPDIVLLGGMTVLEIEQSSDIAVHFLSEMLGFGQTYRTSSASRGAVAQNQAALALLEDEHGAQSPTGRSGRRNVCLTVRRRAAHISCWRRSPRWWR